MDGGKLSPMTGYQPPRTIKSGWKTEGPCRSNKLDEKTLYLRLLALKRIPLGTYTIVSNQIHRRGPKRYLSVFALCSHCGLTREVDVRNIEQGTSRGCPCSGNIKFQSESELRLSERYHSIVQRCSNPKNENWDNYGGRGIKNKFKDAVQFVRYIRKELPHEDYKGIDIGRKDNDGNYEPGNLQLETREQNLRNKRNNHWVMYKEERIIQRDLHNRLRRDYPDFSFGYQWTAVLSSQGLTWEQILKRGQNRKRATRKLS